MKINKGDQEAYNAKQRRNRVKGNRSKTRASDVQTSYPIEHGRKPNHNERIVTAEITQKYKDKYGKKDVGIRKTIWDDYDVDKMCIRNNPNFVLAWTKPDDNPLLENLIAQTAADEEVPVGMVLDELDIVLGRKLSPYDMTVEDVLPPNLQALISDEEIEARLAEVKQRVADDPPMSLDDFGPLEIAD